MTTNKTFVDKFFDKLGDIMKPSEKKIMQIQSRSETIEKISEKAGTLKSKLSKFELLSTTYYFIFFFILAWACRLLG